MTNLSGGTNKAAALSSVALAFAVSGGQLMLPTLASAQTAPAAYTMTYVYNNAAQLVGRISPSTTSTNYEAVRLTYAPGGQLTQRETGYLAAWYPSTTNPASWANFTVTRRETLTYDTYGRLIQSLISDGTNTLAVSQLTYDANERISCIAQRMNLAALPASGSNACAQGTVGSAGPDLITQYTYDSLDRKTVEARGVGTTSQQNYLQISYGSDSEVIKITDGRANVTTSGYDGFDRISQVNYPTPSPAGAGTSNSADYESYTYDSNDNLLTRRRRDGLTTSFNYDALNRIISEIVPSGSNIYRTYDLQSNLLSQTYSSTGGTGVYMTYDTAGRILTEATSGRTLTYSYDADGDRKTITWPDSFKVTYAYDALDRLQSVLDPTGTTVVSMGYDAESRRTSLSRSNGVTTAYGYDGADRLTSLSHSFPASSQSTVSYGFSYTPGSQLASRTVNNSGYVWPASLAQAQSKSFDGLNRDAAFVAISGMNSKGDVAYDGSRTFTYDFENKIIGETGPVAVSLTYDPMGRLNQYTVNGATTQFLYSGSDLVAEYDGSGNLLRRYVQGSGVDEPLVWYEGIGTATPRWFHQDRQGSVVAWSNASGAAGETDRYGPNGEPQAWAGARFRYTGQIVLPEMNLYDYKARFYDPNLGRFLQPDPIGYADGPDWYLYAHDDPVNGSDPTGTDDNTVSSVTVTAEKWVSDFVGEHFGFDGVTNQKSDVGRESPTTVSAVTVTAKKPQSTQNQNNQSKDQMCKAKVGVTLALDGAGVGGSLLPGENLAVAGANLALNTASMVNSGVQGSPEGVAFGAVGYHLSAFGPAAATLGKGFAESLPVVGTVFAVGVLAYDGSQAQKAYNDCMSGR